MMSYLKFLLKSTNQYGVHSPFVYDYLTKCLYKKPRLSKDKLEDVVLKSVSYFNCKNAQIADKGLSNKLTALKYGVLPFDLVVFKEFLLKNLVEMMEENKIHTTTLFIVQNLEKNMGEWKKAIAHPKIKVTIDGFYVGILFVRKEQVKEHFTIRL